MASAYCRGLRARLYMLVFVAVVPVFGVIVFHAVQDRQASMEQAGRELQRLAQTAAFDYRVLAEGGSLRASTIATSPPVTVATADRAGFHKTAITNGVQIGRVRALPPSAGAEILNTNSPSSAILSANSLVWLNEFVERLQLPPGAHALLIRSDGTVISSHPGPDGVIGNALDDGALLRGIQAQPEGGIVRGLTQVVGFAPIWNGAQRIDAHVLVAVPRANAYAESDRRTRLNLGLLAATALLMCLLVRWLSTRLLLRPMGMLTQALERFGAGDMSARTGLSQGAGELVRLARGFDRMAEHAEQQAAEQRRNDDSIRRLRRGNMLFTRLSYAIVHQRERVALLRELCCILVEDGGFAFSWVGWADDARGVRAIVHYGSTRRFLGGFALPVNAGAHPGLRALQEQRIVVCNDLQSAPPNEPWRSVACALGHRAWGAVPLRMEGRVVATFNLLSTDADAFSEEEQRLLSEVASDVSFALDTMMQETQRREAEKRLKFVAYHDPVTELPNLLHYDELVKALRERARESAKPFALMIIGIERLQEVTATFGYHVEGELLQLIAQRLRQCTRAGDVLARGAGTNFNVVFPNTGADMALRSAHHVLKIMEQPFAIQGMDIELGVAIGIALFPEHGEEPDLLNRCAYTALAEARKTGSGHVLYSPGQELFSPERLTLVSELRHAIDNDHLTLVYQPKVNLANGTIAGFEALARWTHPLRGEIPPDQFIAVAEQTGLIRALTDWVIETVTTQSHQFSRAGHCLPISINLSTLNLVDAHLPARLHNHCLAWSVEPSAIELEITESALMQDPSDTQQVLQRLNKIGYLLYIDDFGTGYSSLGYLKKLPVGALKIDKSFVLDMLQNRDAHQIVRSTIDLAHDLGLKVVAEGVETQEVLGRLRSLGCDMAQGYHIARPMPPQKLLEWLATTSWRARPANARVLPRGGKSSSTSPRKGNKKKIL